MTTKQREEKKEELEELSSGDAIAVFFGFSYLKAIVDGNNGSHITWHSEKWLKSSAKVSSYKEMEAMKWTYIGKWKLRFLLPNKLELL